MGKSTISMAIFNSYVSHNQRVSPLGMVHGFTSPEVSKPLFLTADDKGWPLFWHDGGTTRIRWNHCLGSTWWLIPLSKWVITPVISYKWINPTYPIYNWGYNPLTKWDEPPSSQFLLSTVYQWWFRGNGRHSHVAFSWHEYTTCSQSQLISHVVVVARLIQSWDVLISTSRAHGARSSHEKSLLGDDL